MDPAVPSLDSYPKAYLNCIKILIEFTKTLDAITDFDIRALLTDKDYTEDSNYKNILESLPYQAAEVDYKGLECVLAAIVLAASINEDKDYKPSKKFRKIVDTLCGDKSKKKAAVPPNKLPLQVAKLGNIANCLISKLSLKDAVKFCNTLNRLDKVCCGKFRFVSVFCKFFSAMLADNVDSSSLENFQKYLKPASSSSTETCPNVNKTLLLDFLLNCKCIVEDVCIVVSTSQSDDKGNVVETSDILHVSPFTPKHGMKGVGLTEYILGMVGSILKVDPLADVLNIFTRNGIAASKGIGLSPRKSIVFLIKSRNMYQTALYIKHCEKVEGITLKLVTGVCKAMTAINSMDATSLTVIKALFKMLKLSEITALKELCKLLCDIKDVEFLQSVCKSLPEASILAFLMMLVGTLYTLPELHDTFTVSALSTLDEAMVVSEDVTLKREIAGKVSMIIDVMVRIEAESKFYPMIARMLELFPITGFKEKTVAKLVTNCNSTVFKCAMDGIKTYTVVAGILCNTTTPLESKGAESIYEFTLKLDMLVDKLCNTVTEAAEAGLLPKNVLDTLMSHHAMSGIVFKYPIVTQQIGDAFVEKYLHVPDVLEQAIKCAHFDGSKYVPGLLLYTAVRYDKPLYNYIVHSDHYRHCVSKQCITQEQLEKYDFVLQSKPTDWS